MGRGRGGRTRRAVGGLRRASILGGRGLIFQASTLLHPTNNNFPWPLADCRHAYFFCRGGKIPQMTNTALEIVFWLGRTPQSSPTSRSASGRWPRAVRSSGLHLPRHGTDCMPRALSSTTHKARATLARARHTWSPSFVYATHLPLACLLASLLTYALACSLHPPACPCMLPAPPP